MDMAGGEEGKGEMYGESNMEIFNAIYKIANGNLLYDLGNSNRGSVTKNDGVGDGREVGQEETWM